MTPVYLSTPAIISALGQGLSHHINQLINPSTSTPLTPSSQWVQGKNYYFGAINQALRPFNTNIPIHHRSRTNQLLWHILPDLEPQIEQAKQRYGASRIAVAIGTSTSGADENITMFQQIQQGANWQQVSFNQAQHIMSAPAEFIGDIYQLGNLRNVISTACTSGARALISAARWLRAGLCDAVICGGVDSLSPLTINGFAALEVLSDGIANPFSANRNGINIGEAAALFIMTRDDDFDSKMQLLGYGASSDAYHMSSPRPDGLGAAQAFQTALNHAHLSAQDIGWINLHGTGTHHNDSMESQAVAQIFGNQVAITSTKPLTGHTLGAAGAIEAAFAWGIANHQFNPQGKLPPQWWDKQIDPALPQLNFTDENSVWTTPKRRAASSSFAFGGSNCVLIVGE